MTVAGGVRIVKVAGGDNLTLAKLGLSGKGSRFRKSLRLGKRFRTNIKNH